MSRSIQHIKSFFSLAIVLATLSACQSTTIKQSEGVGYREARFAEVAAIREWRSCRDEALTMDRQARKGGDTAKYMASAKLLTKCEANMGSDAASAAIDERFRAYALSALNYLRAGDISAAHESLKKLQKGFPGKDLYLADGASFIDSMETLIGVKNRQSVNEFPMRNISGELKKELRRIRYWKNH